MAEDRPPFWYDARLAGEIERRWQERWEREGTFRAQDPGATARPKFYLLDFFPYPSGIGLHVGHPLGYIGTDVFGRYQRMTGRHVLHPFGFDTFGLPAEQYAIDTGQHPAVTVRRNADVMRRQLRRLGLAHDHSREIMTSDPSYYRWTQWIFLRIFNSWYDPVAERARPVADLFVFLSRAVCLLMRLGLHHFLGVSVRPRLPVPRYTEHAASQPSGLNECAYMYKRKEFSFEREMRALIAGDHYLAVQYHNEDDSEGTPEDHDYYLVKPRDPHLPGVFVPVDLNKLVARLVIAPSAPEWFVEAVKSITTTLGFCFPVCLSEVARMPPLLGGSGA